MSVSTLATQPQGSLVMDIMFIQCNRFARFTGTRGVVGCGGVGWDGMGWGGVGWGGVGCGGDVITKQWHQSLFAWMAMVTVLK